MDIVYEYAGDKQGNEMSMPLFCQVQVWIHTFFCQDCAQKIERFEAARFIMCEDFFPPSPNLEESIMTKVSAEKELVEAEPSFTSPGRLSTRGWVITGLIILVSLVTVFFGLDFQNLASESGMSIMLPMGITIGIVLTTYGAFFIGSHLKELSERFGL
jgi:hypothetical protein